MPIWQEMPLAPWVKGGRLLEVPEGGTLLSSTPCSMWSHPSAMTPWCPVVSGVLRSDPACPTMDHQQSHRMSPKCQGPKKPLRLTGVNWRALLKAAAFTPAGLWLRASAATDTLLISLLQEHPDQAGHFPHAGRTAHSASGAHQPQEYPAGPAPPAPLAGKHLLGCGAMIQS